jgi:hypothetical protein
MSLEIYGLDLRLAKKMLFTGVNLRINKPNLVVYVIDEAGDFIEGADVNILSAGHELDSVTDALGTALTRFMPAINNTLTVSKDGYATSTQIIYNETPSTLSVYVQLYASEIRLKVVNNQNEPIEGATCRVLNAIGGSNNVLSFDRIDDHLKSATSDNSVNTYTIELVLNHSGTGYIYDQAIPRRIISYGWNASGIGIYDGAWKNFGVSIPTGWHRVSIVFNNTSCLLYIDGVKSGNTLTINVWSIINPRFFRVDSDGGAPWGGLASDIRIWKKARSQPEIDGDKNKRLVGDEIDLLMYYKLDEGTGIVATNLTGGSDGVITGATWEESDESFPLYSSGFSYDTATPYDTGTTNANGLTTLNYQINRIHGLEVTLPGKRRFIMPFQRTTRGLLDWQVMLSDYLATFATDRGNILINSEPENNDANFLIE